MISEKLRLISIKYRLKILVSICIIMMLAVGAIGISSLNKLAQNGFAIKESADKLVKSVKDHFEKTKQITTLQTKIEAFIRNPKKQYIDEIKKNLADIKKAAGNLEEIDLLTKRIKILAIRQESFNNNINGIISAFDSIQENVGLTNELCTSEYCKQAITISIDTIRVFSKLLNKIMSPLLSIPERKKIQEDITNKVEEVADTLENLAQNLSNPEKDAILKIQNSFYDLDDAVSSVVAIGVRVSQGQKDIINLLQRLNAKFLSSNDNSFAKEMEMLADKGLILAKRTTYLMSAGIAIGIFFLIIVSILFIASITRPLDEFRRLIAKMSSGDLTGRLTIIGRDELNEIAAAFNDFLSKFSQIVFKASDIGKKLDKESDTLESLAIQMTDEAKCAVSASDDATIATEELSKFMEETKQQMNNLLEATNEIASNTMTTAELANSLQNRMGESSEVISELEEYANQVGQVTKVIRNITDQTTLLALNATIEAARAGEAGKGFAVVAEEVKQLAKQTQEATERIAPLIENIQANVKRAVEAISKSNDATNEINEAINTVAAAAEEQTATYQEINQQIESGVGLTENIKDKMSVLKNESLQNLSESEDLKELSSEIKRDSSELKKVISGFKC